MKMYIACIRYSNGHCILYARFGDWTARNRDSGQLGNLHQAAHVLTLWADAENYDMSIDEAFRLVCQNTFDNWD